MKSTGVFQPSSTLHTCSPKQKQRRRAAILNARKRSGDKPSRVREVSDDDDRKCCSFPRDHFQEFCEKTSLHGLQYLGERRRSLAERTWWLIAICVSIFMALFFIRKQWIKWQTSPVIVTFSESSTPMWEIPFPAVTICSEVKFRQSVFNFSDLMLRNERNNLTVHEKKELEYASLLCDLYTYDEGNPTISEDVIDFYVNVRVTYAQDTEITPRVEFILKSCQWKMLDVDCKEIFRPVITEDGLCYTFNSLAVEELFTRDVVKKNLTHNIAWEKSKLWTIEGGYATTIHDANAYPRRTMSSGMMAGLSVHLLSQDIEADPMCRLPLEGFKMTLHNPAVFPEVTEEFFRVPSARDVVIGVHPKVIRTQEELRTYPPQARKCFFENEHKLRYFTIYTQENCEIECYTNYTLDKCHCVEYYMQRHEDTPICGSGMVNCVRDVMGSYNYAIDYHDVCNCLPGCTEIRYDVEVSQAEYMWDRIKVPVGNKCYGSFSIFLRDMQIITRKRSELFGSTDFLANCGGLLGLFLGFSFLSLVEIGYFLTARLCANLDLHNPQRGHFK